MSGPVPLPHPREPERGNALLLAMFFLIVSASIVLTGTLTTDTLRQNTDHQFRVRGQATQFARSGLTEAISWFRRQTTQPVVEMAPRLEPAASPPIMDTDEPDLGLVREFRIGGRLFGRYEVWKPWAADPVPERALLRGALAARDVSRERTFGPGGTGWLLRAAGIVFERSAASRGFDELPNRVLARQVFEAEILRLRLSPPGTAAICIRDGSAATVRANTTVDGHDTAAGILSLQGTGGPNVTGTLAGQPGFVAAADYACSTESVFGVGLRDLVTTADLVVEDVAHLPVPLPSSSLIVIDAGNLVLDASRPLRGSAVVFVNGDLTISAGSASAFTGLLYVNGNVRISAPANLDGAIVVSDGHTLELIGTGDWVRVDYDPEILDHLRREIGQYRIAGPLRAIGTNGSDG